jgi:xanthine dehydrogenase accessory factor
MSDIFGEATRLLDAGQEGVLVTVVEVHGSAPSRVGAKMVVTADETSGTVGGGALEKRLIERAHEILDENGGACLEKVHTQEVDMECGGYVSAFLEPLRSGQDLWIFGGGHIARALVPMVGVLGFRVTVVDNREEFASRERFGGRARTLHGDYLELVSRIPRGSYSVIVTHGHRYDKDILKRLARIEPKLPYIGMIGSRRKVAAAVDELTAEGIELGENFYAPIGLDLGGNSPAQIALCIAAEIQAVSQGKAGLPHCRNRVSR